MNSSSCCSEDGLLVAGYVAESFPALYRNDIGQWAGITNGYLRDLALMLGCEKGVEYKQYTSAGEQSHSFRISFSLKEPLFFILFSLRGCGSYLELEYALSYWV